MTGTAIVSEIISILVAGISGIATGIGGGLKALVDAVFFTTTGTGSDAVTTMSTFGIMVCVFAGISLAVGQPFETADYKLGENGGALAYRVIPC